jgi:hypothetical protein
MDETPQVHAGLSVADDPDGRLEKRSRSRTATEILPFLPPDLHLTLASLHGAPESVATATVQLLPFGSRAVLETLDPPLARPGRPLEGQGGHSLVLTRFCYEVMAVAADAEEDAVVVPDWDQRAVRAAATVHNRAHR